MYNTELRIFLEWTWIKQSKVTCKASSRHWSNVAHASWSTGHTIDVPRLSTYCTRYAPNVNAILFVRPRSFICAPFIDGSCFSCSVWFFVAYYRCFWINSFVFFHWLNKQYSHGGVVVLGELVKFNIIIIETW